MEDPVLESEALWSSPVSLHQQPYRPVHFAQRPEYCRPRYETAAGHAAIVLAGVNAPQPRCRAPDRRAVIALLGDHVIGVEVDEQVRVPGEFNQVHGLTGGVDQVIPESAHRLDRQAHAEARSVLREDAQVLRRTRQFLRRRGPTADPAGMAVVRAAVRRRTARGGAFENLLMPREPPGSAAGIVVGNVALHRPDIAGADAELDAEGLRMPAQAPVIKAYVISEGHLEER